MNAQPKVKKETKNKIKVEFDRTPLIERLQAKLLHGHPGLPVPLHHPARRLLHRAVPVLHEDRGFIHEPR